MPPRQVIVTSAALLALLPAAHAFPSDVKLTNGVVLHKCSPVRWGNDYVVIRHLGGADPIQFKNISAEQRDSVMAERAGAVAQPHQAAHPDPKTLHVEGACYITTKGAGAYKMSDVVVMIFPATIASLFETNLQTVRLPAPLRTCSTDADGKFTVDLNPDEGPWLVVAQARRRVGAIRNQDPWEYYEWRVPYDGQGGLKLTAQNCYSVQHTLKVGE